MSMLRYVMSVTLNSVLFNLSFVWVQEENNGDRNDVRTIIIILSRW